MTQVSLAEAIQNLRSELSLAMKAPKDDDLRLMLGPIEMELEVSLGRDVEGKAGIKWWVVEAGAGAKQSSKSTHKVKLTLDPVDRAGERIPVSNTRDGRPD